MTFLQYVVPRSARQYLQLHLERRNLAAMPARQLPSVAPLLPSRAVSLEAMFVDAAIEERWRQASVEISRFSIRDGTGGVNPGDRRAVYYLVAALRSATLLEIGTDVGASTVHLAAALRDHAAVTTRRLVTVDVRNMNDPLLRPWSLDGTAMSPAEMMQTLRCGFVEFVIQQSLTFLRTTRDQYDLVFLDGDHAAGTVYQEILAALTVLAPGGALLLHDYFPDLQPLWNDGSVIHGPFLAVERLRAEGLPIEAVPLGRLPWRTKNDSSATSLALLLRTD